MPTYLNDLADLGTCQDVMKHMKSCPECQKQFGNSLQNDSFFTSTNVTIITLLIVIGMLLVKLK